jgi:hypothetical protein
LVDIFDEVDEDLRADKARDLAKRYGGVVVVVAVVIVLAVAGWQGWRWWQNKHDLAAASQYIAAQTAADAKTSDAQTLMEQVARTAPAGYQSLARLRLAAMKAETGDLPGAVAIWDRIASDSSVDPLLRDVATLVSVLRQIDAADPALLEARLKPMAAPDNPFHALASEQIALLDLRQGRVDAAKTTLRLLSQDAAAPNGVRNRAGGLLARLGG